MYALALRYWTIIPGKFFGGLGARAREAAKICHRHELTRPNAKPLFLGSFSLTEANVCFALWMNFGIQVDGQSYF